MAYEKYIKKDGKVYGPYLYHSKRVDGKVVTEYYSKKKTGYGKILWIVLTFLLIALGAYIIGHREDKLTGYSVLDLNADYQEGQSLDGKVKISLQEGELIPASSTVVFENAGKKYEYPIKDLISEPTEEGSFFLKEKAISGSGQGFGTKGTREVYPDVYFILLVYSSQNETEGVTTESEKEIQGTVSKEKIFTYELQEGERFELKPRSVRTSSEQIPDDSLSLTKEENLVSVSTTYLKEEEGFGDNYSGEKVKEFTINLNELDLLLEKGNLKIGVFYEGQEIVSLETTIGNDTVSSESEIVTQTPQQTFENPENKSNDDEVFDEPEKIAVIPVINYKTELTTEELAALENEFGNISLETKEQKTKNGFIIVRYELREDTWVNYSYSSDLDVNTLNSFIQQDRTKWLKDLAKKYSV